MVWIIGILVVIIVVLLTFIFAYKREIQYITRQITESKGELYTIKMRSTDKDIEKLVLSINDLYVQHHQMNLETRNNEEELRVSIENMSHDLRTPLTSIMGYIQLIKDGHLSDSERSSYLEIVEKRTKSLRTLIASFYDLSRIEAREYRFHMQAINVNRLLCDTLALFYQDFLDKGIAPEVHVNQEVPNIIADENAVIRIFTNIINNMLKHGEKQIIINLHKDGDRIITQFINNAPNVNCENVHRIFDRFFTVDTTRSNQNTGIGLAITKALVEQLGHTIEAYIEDELLTIQVTWAMNISHSK